MAEIIPLFTPETRQRCANYGIDIDASYAELLLEIRVGGPAAKRILTAVAAPPTSHLTPREAEVATLLGHGLQAIEIAEALELRPQTVAFHIKNALRRTGCRTRTQLAVETFARGLVEDHLRRAA